MTPPGDCAALLRPKTSESSRFAARSRRRGLWHPQVRLARSFCSLPLRLRQSPPLRPRARTRTTGGRPTRCRSPRIPARVTPSCRGSCPGRAPDGTAPMPLSGHHAGSEHVKRVSTDRDYRAVMRSRSGPAFHPRLLERFRVLDKPEGFLCSTALEPLRAWLRLACTHHDTGTILTSGTSRCQRLPGRAGFKAAGSPSEPERPGGLLCGTGVPGGSRSYRGARSSHRCGQRRNDDATKRCRVRRWEKDELYLRVPW